jgi:hypothetical protein
MNVASPLAQQSWMLGQRASWQTVCNLLSATAALVSLKMACCLPFGNEVLNHSGNLSRFGFSRKAGGIGRAIGSGLPVIPHPPCPMPRFDHQKGV